MLPAGCEADWSEPCSPPALDPRRCGCWFRSRSLSVPAASSVGAAHGCSLLTLSFLRGSDGEEGACWEVPWQGFVSANQPRVWTVVM